MSVVDKPARTEGVSFDELPEFDLECLYDDREKPSEVTVFSTDDRDSLYAAWVTVDAAHAVPLEEVR